MLQYTDDDVMVYQADMLKSLSLKPSSLMCIADDVLERMMDDRSASDCRSLLGHSGPVYATSFSSDRYFLLSASEDGSSKCWYFRHWWHFGVILFLVHYIYAVSWLIHRCKRMWLLNKYRIYVKILFLNFVLIASIFAQHVIWGSCNVEGLVGILSFSLWIDTFCQDFIMLLIFLRFSSSVERADVD